MNPLFTLALAQKTNCCQDKTVVDECVSTAEEKLVSNNFFMGLDKLLGSASNKDYVQEIIV